jgi:hypothetical protein
MDKETSKAQDKMFMDAIQAFLSRATAEQKPLVVTRIHERNMQVAFPDGRIVSLVLYGPRGHHGS